MIPLRGCLSIGFCLAGAVIADVGGGLVLAYGVASCGIFLGALEAWGQSREG